jgi:ATP-binding cassette subfamily C protein
VAHRLSSIKQADRILVFEDGHIIESGSHEDLVVSGGTYQRPYR